MLLDLNIRQLVDDHDFVSKLVSYFRRNLLTIAHLSWKYWNQKCAGNVYQVKSMNFNMVHCWSEMALNGRIFIYFQPKLCFRCSTNLGKNHKGRRDWTFSMTNSWTVSGSYKTTTLDSQFCLTSCTPRLIENVTHFQNPCCLSDHFARNGVKYLRGF